MPLSQRDERGGGKAKKKEEGWFGDVLGAVRILPCRAMPYRVDGVHRGILRISNYHLITVN